MLLGQIRELDLGVDKPLRVLDVGGGRGVLQSDLESVTPWSVDVVDPDTDCIARCSPGRGRAFVYDVTEEQGSLLRAYDVVCLCDVLEHVEETRSFLTSVLKHLKPGGVLLVNVPWGRSLYCAYDEAVGHCRRYGLESLMREFTALPVKIVDVRYWGAALIPLLVLRALLTRIRASSAANTVRMGFKPPGPKINRALKQIGRVETRAFGRSRFGASILIAYRTQ